eukprot:3497780-Rhodomonas_salina.1
MLWGRGFSTRCRGWLHISRYLGWGGCRPVCFAWFLQRSGGLRGVHPANFEAGTHHPVFLIACVCVQKFAADLALIHARPAPPYVDALMVFLGVKKSVANVVALLAVEPPLTASECGQNAVVFGNVPAVRVDEAVVCDQALCLYHFAGIGTVVHGHGHGLGGCAALFLLWHQCGVEKLGTCRAAA